MIIFFLFFRELNELRRPVSDNPEILRFFKYMKAARRGQEASDCTYSYPTCSANAQKTHTMVAAYHDINKLVSARKLHWSEPWSFEDDKSYIVTIVWVFLIVNVMLEWIVLFYKSEVKLEPGTPKRKGRELFVGDK